MINNSISLLRSKSLNKSWMACFLVLTLLLNACTVNPDNPDNEDPDINNPTDPNDPDPEYPNEQDAFRLGRSDIIRNLGLTSVRFDAEMTQFGFSNPFEEIIDIKKVQPYVDFVLKNYASLSEIFNDYPTLSNTKEKIDDSTDSYTLPNESQIYVRKDGEIRYFSPYFAIEIHKKSYETDNHFYSNNQPFRVMLFSNLLVLFDNQYKVKFAYQFEDALYHMNYGNFLDERKVLSFVDNFKQTRFYTLTSSGISYIDLLPLQQHVDKLSYGYLNGNGYKFDVYVANDENNAYIKHHSVLPSKLFQPVYKSGGTSWPSNPLVKESKVLIDSLTNKAVFQVRWSFTDLLSPSVVLAYVNYTSNDLTIESLKHKETVLRYEDSEIINTGIKKEDLMIFNNDQKLLDIRLPIEDIASFFEPDGFNQNELDELLATNSHPIKKSFTQDGITIDFKNYHQVFNSTVYTISNSQLSFNKKYHPGLTKTQLINLLGIPDLVDNDGLPTKDWNNDHQWTYFILDDEYQIRTGGNHLIISSNYYGYVKLSFIFEGDVVKQIKYILFVSFT